MYCSLDDQVKSSMLPGQHRRRPVCRMLIFDILGRRDHRESLSVVDGALRCCGSADTVQTSMAVPCRADTCRPWHRVWTWNAQGRPANVGRYDECLLAHGRTCDCQIHPAPQHSLRAVARLVSMITRKSSSSVGEGNNSSSSGYSWAAGKLRVRQAHYGAHNSVNSEGMFPQCWTEQSVSSVDTEMCNWVLSSSSSSPTFTKAPATQPMFNSAVQYNTHTTDIVE